MGSLTLCWLHFYFFLFLVIVSYIYFRVFYGITMIIDTTVIDLTGSIYVRVPKAFVEYFNLKPGKCKIKDTGSHTVELTFSKW